MSDVILGIPFSGEESPFRIDDFENIYYATSKTTTESPYNNDQSFASSDKPVKCTEVFSKLREKGWGKSSGRFLYEGNEESTLMYRTYSPMDLPNDEIDLIDTGYKVGGYISNDEETIADEIRLDESFRMNYEETYNKEEYNQLKEKILDIFGNDMTGDEIIFHNSSRASINILDNIFTFDLISPDTGIYTNTVDLSEIIKYSCSPDLSGKVDMTIQYSKNNVVYSKDIMFTAFRYDSSGILHYGAFREDLKDVVIYYDSGKIEVFPSNQEVDEYIIYNCTVEYGKL